MFTLLKSSATGIFGVLVGVNKLDLKKKVSVQKWMEIKIRWLNVKKKIIDPIPNDHDSGDNNNEIQVQDQEESGIIDTSHLVQWPIWIYPKNKLISLCSRWLSIHQPSFVQPTGRFKVDGANNSRG